MERTKLKCSSCGGTVDIDGTREVLFCPFCGSKELINDGSSDAVKIVRNITETVKSVQKEQNRHKEKAREVSDNELQKNRDDNRTQLITLVIILVAFAGLMLFFYSLIPH